MQSFINIVLIQINQQAEQVDLKNSTLYFEKLLTSYFNKNRRIFTPT